MEIKFRAWDKNHKEMIYISDLYWFEQEGVHDGDGNGHYTNYELMPFSGIHDKNGKEIYEGDIVLTQEMYDKPYAKNRKSKKHIGVVEYKIRAGSGFYDSESGNWDKHKEYGAEWIVNVKDYGKFVYSNWGDFFDCEVIGNVYENPELLNTVETVGCADQNGLASAT